MPYLDRLEKLQYQSPKRKVFTLDFDTVVRSGGKKIGINEFPNQDETNEQELGNIANRFPLTCYITGKEYDREADRFFKALEENGVGTLDHPRWGSYDVIPITYSQTEEFVDGMGRAIFVIEFIRYYPEANAFYQILNDIAGIVQLVIDAIDFALSFETSIRRFGRAVNRQIGTTLSESNRIQSKTKSILSQFSKQEKNFGVRTQELADEINNKQKEIERNIDDLVSEPASLVQELNSLFSLPAKVISSIESKINGYSDMLIFTGQQINTPNLIITPYEASIQGCVSTAIMSSLIQSTLEGNLNTRTEAISVAETLYQSNLKIKEIYDRVTFLGGNVNYEIYYQIQKFINICQRLLIQRSLNLPTERSVVLEKDVSPIKFCYEVLGDIDKVNSFIDYNRLIGDEILIMPEGKTVRYIP